jgi:hypothetical protein
MILEACQALNFLLCLWEDRAKELDQLSNACAGTPSAYREIDYPVLILREHTACVLSENCEFGALVLFLLGTNYEWT